MRITMRARLRRGSVITVAVVACLVMSTSGARGGPPASGTPLAVAAPAHAAAPAQEKAVGSPGAPTAEPKSLRAARRPATGTRTCTAPVNGRFDCLETRTAPNDATAAAKAAASVSEIPDFPEWCAEQLDAVRTEACEIWYVTRTLWHVRNGTVVITGGMEMEIHHLARTSTISGVWRTWFAMFALNAWGDALRSSAVTASISASGQCGVRSESFPTQSLLPVGVVASGSAELLTQVRRTGAIGHCSTTWSHHTDTPGYPPGNVLTVTMTDIRCDYATRNTLTIGCVVPWAPANVYYSMEDYPTLALHVLAAQGSGLPGGPDGSPLTRTTNDAIEDVNRRLACGDAPSFPGYSCDEYPPASSYQGLSAGGTRRVTRGGCMFPNLPRDVTGVSGVSVCMIIAGENNAQGSLHGTAFRQWRVLDGDPWRVEVVA